MPPVFKITAVCLSLTLFGCGTDNSPPADQIYLGEIITMNDAQPRAEALAVKDGLILAVGDAADVLKHQGASTVVRHLDTQAMTPGFIDAHGHMAIYALLDSDLDTASPPIGPVTSIPDLLSRLKAHIKDNSLAEDALVFSFGYDDSLLAEKRHPLRTELDSVSETHKILLIHTSGHLAAANSAALAAAGFTDDSPDPKGGSLWRDKTTGKLNGIVDEQAVFRFFSLLQKSPEDSLKSLIKAAHYYASFGITTAQDGQTQAAGLKLLRGAAAQNLLPLDVVSYPKWTEYEAMMATDTGAPGQYQNHVKWGGVKITQDGSPQGKTAYLTQPYHVPPLGQDASYRGHPIMPQAELDSWVEKIFAADQQLLLHCNGDACADMMIAAVDKATEKLGPKDRRPVMIHAQTIRPDQIIRLKDLGIIPSFFAAHSFYWGDWHRDEVLGPERAARISPMATAQEAGLHFTLHNDAPVVPPNIIFLMHTAVNRTTRSGKILGPTERISAESALKAVTLDAAYQYFEEGQKGSLEVGKQADMVILSQNPLTIAPERLKDVTVLETVNDGKSIYRKD
ncbi:amidohydrolase [Paremcibacter congregatus]|uniref:amidohydrolase n=1 Tax=Paremcibacter congregatus TaxID=2043170 RepID=UPI0030EF4423|tara:strand:+ start:629 stop:2326 length:1698 start_codon:yes stop_codon:yes gene_type:complete